MNAEDLTKLSQQLAPIELPPAANWNLIICVVGSLIAIIAVFLIMRWLQGKAGAYQNNSPTQLPTIQQAWQRGDYDSRACAYQLATLLRQQFKLGQLDHKAPAQLAEFQDEWQLMIQLLDQLRYQQDQQAELNETHFSQIQAWLLKAKSCLA